MAEIDKRVLNMGEVQLPYTLIYAERKTLGISVNPEGSVWVKAPLTTTMEQIEQKLQKRAGWIIRQQQFFQSFGEVTPKRRYISGESHLYLGRQYMLRVTEGKRNEVRYRGHYFEVECTNKDKVESLMNEWYNARAKLKFPEIAEPILQKFESYQVSPKGLYIQQMKYRWGSCTRSGKIILNRELIKTPRPCIEYVIVHEMCHLVHPNHTKEFYHLLEKIMPDWEKWKNKLERVMR